MSPSDEARGLRILRAILAERGDSPFRKANLTEALVRSTNSRRGSFSHRQEWAQSLATAVIANALGMGLIQRHGHMHWVRSSGGRKLLDGRVAAEADAFCNLPIGTRCPEKWIAVDAETGEVWQGSIEGWAKGSSNTMSLLRLVANPKS